MSTCATRASPANATKEDPTRPLEPAAVIQQGLRD
jgi:hypothetical protein